MDCLELNWGGSHEMARRLTKVTLRDLVRCRKWGPIDTLHRRFITGWQVSKACLVQDSMRDQESIGTWVVGATGGLESARVKTKLRALGASPMRMGRCRKLQTFWGDLH